MTLILYDLVARRSAHFSPNSWRVRMALAHKSLEFEERNILFTGIKDIHAGQRLTIPTIEHEGVFITDSWAIVQYLDDRFPQTPHLIPAGPDGQVLRFFQLWVQTTMHAGIARLILLDLHDLLEKTDQDYFRSSREKAYGQSLESIQAGRETRVDEFRRNLQPLRLALKDHDFVGGEIPCYADYLAFSALQWARVSSPFKVLAADDPVLGWFERCLDLHGALGRQEPAASPPPESERGAGHDRKATSATQPSA